MITSTPMTPLNKGFHASALGAGGGAIDKLFGNNIVPVGGRVGLRQSE